MVERRREMGQVTQRAVFAFAKLVVRDLPREVEFYQAVCGYDTTESLDGSIAGRPIKEVILRTSAGALDLVLLTFLGEPLLVGGNGIVAFDTHDLEDLQKRVLQAGGDIVESITSITVGEKQMRIAHFADPEGHLLEVMERGL